MKKYSYILGGLALLLALIGTGAGGVNSAAPQKKANLAFDGKPPDAVIGNRLIYNNIRVNLRNGVPLLDANGKPLQASRIRVWSPRVDWTIKPGGLRVTQPQGKGGIATGDYRYPDFHIYGVVVGTYQFLVPTFQNVDLSAPPGQVFNFSNGAGIIANVNDSEYSDNSGGFDLVIEILQW